MNYDITAQVALTAPSDFVWVIDDDMIPGSKFLAQLLHAAGTDLMGTSVLGSIGRVLPRPGSDMSLASYRKVCSGVIMLWSFVVALS